ncbi:hypothetical protein HOY80DRAFT_1042303 [Tuber brumale]|nr:hypothetical protein HOY80DRAFT_1042303 [Tuber brumale]
MSGEPSIYLLNLLLLFSLVLLLMAASPTPARGEDIILQGAGITVVDDKARQAEIHAPKRDQVQRVAGMLDVRHEPLRLGHGYGQLRRSAIRAPGASGIIREVQGAGAIPAMGPPRWEFAGRCCWGLDVGV